MSKCLWRLFLASEVRSLTLQEWELVQAFIDRIEQGLIQAFRHDGPLLLIAHGGTYWAISHLLKLERNRKLDNCILTEITLNKEDFWKTKFIS